MRVRAATMDDIPRIVEMSQRFYDATEYAAICPMSKQSAAGLAIITMDPVKGVMLVAEDETSAIVGMVSLFIQPFTFNVAVSMAQELAWWIEPEARGGMLALRMLKAVDAECRAREIDMIRMAVLADSPEQAGALYERCGYARSDTFYTKVMGAS